MSSKRLDDRQKIASRLACRAKQPKLLAFRALEGLNENFEDVRLGAHSHIE